MQQAAYTFAAGGAAAGSECLRAWNVYYCTSFTGAKYVLIHT